MGTAPPMRGSVFFCENLPACGYKRQRRFNLDSKNVLSEVESRNDRFLGYLGALCSCCCAVFAVAETGLPQPALALHRTSGVRSARAGVLVLGPAIPQPGWDLLTALALLTVPVYMLMAMKRAYNSSR